MVAPSGGSGGRKRPASTGGGAKPKRTSAPKKASAAPRKPRASKKKADEDQLSLELAVEAAPSSAPKPRKKPAAPAKPSPAAKPRARAAAKDSEARASQPVAPPRAAPIEAPKPSKARREPTPRVPATPAVRVKLPRRVRLRDFLPRFPRPAEKREPRPPLPIVERILNWLRNAAMVGVVIASLLVMWGASGALLNPPRTPLMWVRYWQGLDDGRFGYAWKPFEELGDPVMLAVVAAADPDFLEDGGLNPRAVRATLSRDGIGAIGPTTLGRLTAANVYGWPSEGWVNGLVEGLFTVVVDLSWNKRRIAEVYANVAEFGPGLYGAEAAAQAWFGKPARELTEAEAALLAACLANPRESNPAAPSPALLAQRDTVWSRMQAMGGPARLRDALSKRGDEEE
ncbi:MAG: hypothetical protein RLZZ303_2512 [Candidatus Hydrogenedentota bacterium]